MQNKLCGILEITQDLEKSVLGLFPGPADSWICHLEQNIHLSWDLNFSHRMRGLEQMISEVSFGSQEERMIFFWKALFQQWW